MFPLALLNSILSISKLEKLRPTYCPGPRQNSAWAPLIQPDDHCLEETLSDTTTIDKEARDPGPVGPANHPW